MLKRFFTFALLVIAFMGFMTSCSIGGGAYGLIQAPKATGDMGKIQQALYAFAGETVSLKYPKRGDNKSAFLLNDLDKDGKQEAVAFYSVVNEEEVTSIHVNIIDIVDGEWQSVQDMEIAGTSIDRAEVVNISGDNPLLLVGIEMFSTSGNQLNVFSYDGIRAKQYVKESYTEFIVGDLVGDGDNQLYLVSLNSTEHSSVVNMYTFRSGVLAMTSSALTDGNITSYAQVMIGKLRNGQSALFIDSYKSTSSMTTDLVMYTNGRLSNPFFDFTVAETQLTLRNSVDLSRDIDGDGITDIPFTELLPSYLDASDSDKHYLTVWKNFDGMLLNDVVRGDFNYEGGYYLEFKDNWLSAVTLVADNANHMRSYRLYDSELQSTGDELLRIRVYNTDDFEKMDTTGIIELARNDTSVWVARIVMTEGEYALDEATLRERFHLL